MTEAVGVRVRLGDYGNDGDGFNRAFGTGFSATRDPTFENVGYCQVSLWDGRGCGGVRCGCSRAAVFNFVVSRKPS